MNDAVETPESPETGMDEDRIIRNHILASMGVGLIPVPLVDLIALTGVQLNMLRKLAKIYEVEFLKDKGKHLIAALLGSGVPVAIGGSLSSLVKAIPVVGQVTGALTMPAAAGATTYAIAKVFIMHFASGGTFLDFDPETVKAYYAEMLKKGKHVADELKKEPPEDAQGDASPQSKKGEHVAGDTKKETHKGAGGATPPKS
jgi:uncharacterized protein (DUF697 family)